MSEPPSRDDLIGLLDRLGSDRDEEVLEAARELRARVADAGLDWDDLLAPDAVAGEVEDRVPEPEPAEAPAAKGGGNAETLALIGKMLAKPGISEDFREELEGYKQDIAAGDFEDRDHDYVRALHKRLSARR
jgi:hypothetical protein